MNEKIKQLSEYINNSNNIVAFTGAGISTDSGIPDFRSNIGLYMTGEFEGYNPENILTRSMLRSNPAFVLRFYKKRLLSLTDKLPNKAHYALKKLEEMGKLQAIVTQNIDDLHRKSGCTNIYELHGNITQYHCNSACNRKYNHDEFLKKLEISELPQCDCGLSYIRPNVVLFDEWLNDDIYDNALKEIQKADLLIVIGSSLVVMPACSLIGEVNPHCKRVIINNQPTPFDKRVNLLINENCGDILDSTLNIIKNI